MITIEQWQGMIDSAVDWQYLTVLAGGMARKSDCDAWLMARYGIDECTARDITNTITSLGRSFTCGRDGVFWQMDRPAPRYSDYPETFGNLVSEQANQLGH